MGQSFHAQGSHSRYQRLVTETRTLSRSREPVSADDIELLVRECPDTFHPCSQQDIDRSGESGLSAKAKLAPSSSEPCSIDTPDNTCSSPACEERRISLSKKGSSEFETTILEDVLAWACLIFSAVMMTGTFILGLTAWFGNFDGAHRLLKVCVLFSDEFGKHIDMESFVILAVTASYLVLALPWSQAVRVVTSMIEHFSSSCSFELPEVPDTAQVTILFTFMYVDQVLDGNVMVSLFQDSFYELTCVFFMLVLLPQLLLWMFFRQLNLIELNTLGYVLCFPSFSMAGLTLSVVLPQMPLPWLGELSIFVACLSLSPLLELCKCCKTGKRSERAFWMTLAEGLLEAAGSATLSLYIVLVHHKSEDVGFLLSIACSMLSTTRSAVELHCYGKQATPWDRARLWFVCLPRVVSRIMTLSFLAYLMRPAMLCFMLILLCGIGSNCAILCLVNSRTTKSSVALFSVIMVFIGSPRFLPSLEEAYVWQAFFQTLWLFCGMGFAALISPLGSESFQTLWQDYPYFTIAWVITTLWSNIAVLVMAAQEEVRSLQERISEANQRLYEAAKSKSVILCSLLLNVEGAEVKRARDWIFPRLLYTGDSRSGIHKWSGVAVHDGKLYAPPNGADNVLVVDPSSQTEIVSHIPILAEVRRAGKWHGICCHSDLLYCSPLNHEDVLIIDPVAKTTRTIPLGVEANNKWTGIAACKGKLYCCPYNHSDVLVIDPLTEKTTYIKTGIKMTKKWVGIVECGDMLYCCPSNHDDVLVIDPDSDSISTIPTGIRMDMKWKGIAVCKGKLYCAPCNHSDVLVIDPVAKKVDTIPTGCELGGEKWGEITAHMGKLYCAPWCHKAVLEIDPALNKVSFIDTGCEGDYKWDGIIAHEGIVYCVPWCHGSVLADACNIVDDRRLLVDLGFGLEDL